MKRLSRNYKIIYPQIYGRKAKFILKKTSENSRIEKKERIFRFALRAGRFNKNKENERIYTQMLKQMRDNDFVNDFGDAVLI